MNFAATEDDIRRLLNAATNRVALLANLAERRRSAFLALLDIVDADAGHWAWGRGNPLTSTVAPVAIIDHGYTPAQLTTLIEHALHPESMAMFQVRAWASLAGGVHGAWSRRDLIPDDEYCASAHWRNYVDRLGFDSWVHAVSYRTSDTWSCLHLLRRTGREEFGGRETMLAAVALTGIEWMNAQAEEYVPPDAFADLTPRRRTVMLMLLDGQSRRQIAETLHLSEYTVDDHIKAIYAHFGVGSVGELAARFLKMA